MPYHSGLQDVINDFLELEGKFPTLVTHEIIGKSWENRDIYMFKIGNPKGGRVLLNGTTHGGEWTGTEVYCLYAHWLLESNTVKANRILSRNYTLIIPSLNVDGYDRKRRVNLNPKGGVNLNRNFPATWRTDCTILGECTNGTCPEGQQCIQGYCYKSGCACGWSDIPGRHDYRGEAPASEPETKAMLAILQRYKPKFVIDYHTWDPNREFARPSWRTGITEQDKAYHRAIYDKCVEMWNKMAVPKPYPRYMALGICGGLADDGYVTGGATSFLIEGLSKDDCGGYINPPYELIEEVAWPQFLAVALVISSECEIPSPIAGPLDIWTFPLVNWLATLFPNVGEKARVVCEDIRLRIRKRTPSFQ